MSTIQSIFEKAKELGTVTLDYVTLAASSLLGSASEKAGDLTLAEISRRLENALRVLRGEESSPAVETATTQKTRLQLAEEMVASYNFDRNTGVSTFTIPAGVSDIEAMKAINEYFRKHYPDFERDAIFAYDMSLYEALPEEFPEYCQTRDCLPDSPARLITIKAVVKCTEESGSLTVEEELIYSGLVLSDPRDQAIAAGLHACRHNGEDLFEGKWVRGSIPDFVLGTHPRNGVYHFCEDSTGLDDSGGVASGSPPTESI